MSTDESALLRAVLTNPEANLPRLVYADWLDDHGQPDRAEFIRLQCEIASHPSPPPLFARREHELWNNLAQDAALTADWLLLGPEQYLLRAGRLQQGQPYGICRRGFVDEVCLPLAIFLDRAADLFARMPVTHVVMIDFRPWQVVTRRSVCRWSPTIVRALGHPPGLASDFPDATAALTALSAACVVHGRAAVGL